MTGNQDPLIDLRPNDQNESDPTRDWEWHPVAFLSPFVQNTVILSIPILFFIIFAVSKHCREYQESENLYEELNRLGEEPAQDDSRSRLKGYSRFKETRRQTIKELLEQVDDGKDRILMLMKLVNLCVTFALAIASSVLLYPAFCTSDPFNDQVGQHAGVPGHMRPIPEWPIAHAPMCQILSIIKMGILVSTWVFAIVYTRSEHYRDHSNSSILMVFWSMMSLAYFTRFSTLVFHESKSVDEASVLVVLLTSIFAFAQTLIENVRTRWSRRPMSFLSLSTSAEYAPIGDAPDTTTKPFQPYRNDISSGFTTEEYRSNFFSRLSFWWVSRIMRTRGNTTLDDLGFLAKEHETKNVSDKLSYYWHQELTNKANPSLSLACAKAFGLEFSAMAFFKLISDILQYVQPMLVREIMRFVQAYDQDKAASGDGPTPRTGYLLACAMLVTALLQSAMLQQYFHVVIRIGIQVRSALIGLIYRKSLRISIHTKSQFSGGEVVNLMSVDAQGISQIFWALHLLWSGPLQISLALYLLCQTLGYSIFAGVTIMIMMIPLNTVMSRKQAQIQKMQMAAKDERAKVFDELLNGIKVVKLYAWELWFQKKVSEKRKNELRHLRTYATLIAAQMLSWTLAPAMVAILTFVVYMYTSDELLTSEKAIVSLSLFNLLQFPLAMFPAVITGVVESKVSFDRILNFLKSQEISQKTVSFMESSDEESPESSVEGSNGNVDDINPYVLVKNGTFHWSPDSETADLEDINISFQGPKLIGIAGSVGSGKSSLLSAILGELYKNEESSLKVRGSVGYVPEESWIFNASIQENVLFGRKMDEDWYQRVLYSCSLLQDLSSMPYGDQTEVGERGVNLSGGQKKRITLARAVYANAQLYLLDDPLSAVDSHVATHIYKHLLSDEGLLKDSLRILVTHQLDFLKEASNIVVMEQGKIGEIGRFDDLMSGADDTKFNTLYRFLKDQHNAMKQASEERPMSPKVSISASHSASPSVHSITEAMTAEEVGLSETGSVAADDANVEYAENGSPSQKRRTENGTVQRPSGGGRLVDDEGVAQGRVSTSVYLMYMRTFSFALALAIILLSALSQFASVGSNVYLQDWSSHPSKETMVQFIVVYSSLACAGSFIGFVTEYLTGVVGAIRSARILFNKMLKNLLRAPLSFFEQTPSGRIMNRFVRDQDVVDKLIPRGLSQLIRPLFRFFSALFVISSVTPIFLALLLPIFVIYYWVQSYYIRTSRAVKRFDSTTRSPIYSQFSETVSGLAVIRAFKMQDKFLIENFERSDCNALTSYIVACTNRWVAWRLELTGAIIIFGSSFFAVNGVVTGTGLSAGLAGLSISYSLPITGTMSWILRQMAEIETNMVSVERVREYLSLPQEAPEDGPMNPPDGWPSTGRVEFVDYGVKYPSSESLVLKNITFKLKPREKVAIVGRTGSGKSTLILSLFRIIEANRGVIKVDNLDISLIGLRPLRQSLTIIPQDPMVFVGTLRENLDPFHKYEDSDIWRVLDNVQLKQAAMQLPAKLDTMMIQGGASFSLGQRQLICLARALLRRSSILLLDEATSQVDLQTDALIQRLIRTEFRSCTVITIAHRISTVLDSDRIIVLENGSLIEHGAPTELLQRPDSYFKGIVQNSFQ